MVGLSRPIEEKSVLCCLFAITGRRDTRGMRLFYRTCVLGRYLRQQVVADKEMWEVRKEAGVPFRNHKDLSSISVVLKDIALFSHA